MSRILWKLGRGVLYYVWTLVASELWSSSGSRLWLFVGALGMLAMAVWFLTGIRSIWIQIFGRGHAAPAPNYNYSPWYNRDGTLHSQHPERS